MNTLCNLRRAVLGLLFTVLCILTGCASTPAGDGSTATGPSKEQRIAAAVRPLCKTTVLLVLRNNPRYDVALGSLAAAADLALNNAGLLTPADIKAFVDIFAKKWQLDAETKILVASAIDDVVRLYLDTYGKQFAETTDPTVRLYLQAFATGIREGVDFYHAFQTAGTP